MIIFMLMIRADFVANGVQFSSMEQFMMYNKAICFSDIEIARKILNADKHSPASSAWSTKRWVRGDAYVRFTSRDVAQIKELGRQVSGYNENIWNGMRQITVYEGLLEKFSQNRDLYKKLKETKNIILAESVGICFDAGQRKRVNCKRTCKKVIQATLFYRFFFR